MRKKSFLWNDSGCVDGLLRITRYILFFSDTEGSEKRDFLRSIYFNYFLEHL